MKNANLIVPIATCLFGGLLLVNCGGSDGSGDAKGGTGGSARGGSGGSGTKGSGSKGGGTGSISSSGGTVGSTSTSGTGGTVTGGTAGSGTGGTPVVAAPSKPIGYWKFDEMAGTAVKDSSGSQMDGLVVQGPSSDAAAHPAPVWTKGHTGMALTLDGTDDWVRIPDSEVLDRTGLNNQVSIAAWVKIDKYNEFKPWTVIAQRHQLASRLEQFMLGINNGTPSGEINFFKIPTLVNVPLNRWVHLAFTYDGIKGVIYMDGAVTGEADLGWPVATDETPFTIGGGINETDVIEFVPGLVDEVRLYDAALTPGEVDALAKQQAD